jgi:alkaline phosphatase D
MNDPHIKWTNFSNRGYVVLDVTEERAQGAWFHFDRVDLATATETFARAFASRAGAQSLVAEAEPAQERADAPPLAPVRIEL